MVIHLDGLGERQGESASLMRRHGHLLKYVRELAERRRPFTVARMSEPDVVDATRRTRLANERTYLAWLRSALTALAVAIGAGKIVPSVADVEQWPFELLGAGFAVLAVIFVVVGVRRYVKVERSLDAGLFAPLGNTEAVLLASLATVLGVATLALVFIH